MNYRFTKLLAVLTAALLILALFPLQALAANQRGEQDGLQYTVTTINRVKIEGYTGAGGAVTIPDTIEGFPVTELHFRNDNITSLTVGANMLDLQLSPLQSWTKLSAIRVSPASKKFASIAGVLFNKAKTTLLIYPRGSTQKSYTAPRGVKTIGSMAFYGCKYLESVALPEGVREIGDSAFSGSGLKSIRLPDSLKTIGPWAFGGCSRLQKIDIPKNVQTINTSAFWDMPALKQFAVASGSRYFYSADGVLFDKARKTLLKYPRAKAAAVYSIPNTVTNVTGSAFEWCPNIKTLSIPASVSKIESINLHSFPNLLQYNVSPANRWYCSSGGVLFNKAKTILYDYPAQKISAGYSVPSTVKTIMNRAFQGSTYLKSVKLPQGLKTIGPYTFYNCAGLSSIVLPQGLETIGSSAFEKCAGLSSIVLPNSVTSLGSFVFAGTNIQKVKLSNALTIINSCTFSGTPLKSVDIPQSVHTLWTEAFSNCAQLKSATIPYTITTIADSFKGCGSLTIKGYAHSRAERYATANHIPFQSIGDTPAFELTVAPNDAAYGSVTGGGSYYYGETCLLRAKAAKGYVFKHWLVDGKKVTYREYWYMVTRAQKITAVFAAAGK